MRKKKPGARSQNVTSNRVFFFRLPAPGYWRLSYTAAMIQDFGQLDEVRRIASCFDIPEPLEVADFPGKGNINQRTYLITAGLPDTRSQYLLQQLNPDVFSLPHTVMDTMILCIQSQEEALSRGIIRDSEWETIRLIQTRDGKHFHRSGGNECWRMMVRIDHVFAFRSLREITDPGMRLRIAEEAGRGLALFGSLTAGLDVSRIGCPLPGYRDTELYYDQLLSVLSGARTRPECEAYLPSDPAVRNSTETHFLVRLNPPEYRRRMEDQQVRRIIELALQQKPFALTLIRKLKAGELKKVIVHGDTKLDNFLFSAKTGRVKALVDLDTIMPHTWLSDWGDMVRSLVNIAGEQEQDLSKVAVDEEVFRAIAKGFLGSAHHADSGEIELMVDAAQVMALELGVRFLTDYLRGDTYFSLKAGDPPDLNKFRALVQFCVFERLRGKADSLAADLRWLSRKNRQNR